MRGICLAKSSRLSSSVTVELQKLTWRSETWTSFRNNLFCIALTGIVYFIAYNNRLFPCKLQIMFVIQLGEWFWKHISHQAIFMLLEHKTCTKVCYQPILSFCTCFVLNSTKFSFFVSYFVDNVVFTTPPNWITN